jgi:hypothetical protein
MIGILIVVVVGAVVVFEAGFSILDHTAPRGYQDDQGFHFDDDLRRPVINSSVNSKRES